MWNQLNQNQFQTQMILLCKTNNSIKVLNFRIETLARQLPYKEIRAAHSKLVLILRIILIKFSWAFSQIKINDILTENIN